MNKFKFSIIIEGEGTDLETAWKDALTKFDKENKKCPDEVEIMFLSDSPSEELSEIQIPMGEEYSINVTNYEEDKNLINGVEEENYIIINGTTIKPYIGPGIIPYDQIVKLAGMTGNPSITFKNHPILKEGILIPGEDIELWNDVIFNVTHTGNT